MSIMLRLVLIAASVLACILVIRRIRKSGLQIDDALFWIVFSFVLIILSVFPNIIYKLADLLKAQSPANLLYLIIIGILIFKVFLMSLHISSLEAKIKVLVQETALQKESHEREN